MRFDALDPDLSPAGINRRITQRYRIALTVVFLVILSGHLVLDRTLVSHETTASEINVAGRQRMLSQQVIALGANLLLAESPGEAEQVRDELRQSIELMASSHALLVDGGPGVRSLADIDDSVSEVYFERPFSLDQRTLDHLETARQLLETDLESNESREVAQQLITELGTPDVSGITTLGALDAAVQQRELAAKTATDSLSLASVLILLVAALVLIGEGFLVFRPMTRQLASTVGDLNVRRQQLRSVLDAAGVGILSVDITGAVNSANPRAVALLGRTPESVSEFFSTGANSVEDWLLAISPNSPKLATLTHVVGGEQKVLEFRLEVSAGSLEGAYSLVITDVTELTRSRDDLDRLLNTDIATGLDSARRFRGVVQDFIDREINLRPLSLVELELSDLADVRQAHGPEVADRLMAEVGNEIIDRAVDDRRILSVARLGDVHLGVAAALPVGALRRRCGSFIEEGPRSIEVNGVLAATRLVAGLAAPRDEPTTAERLIVEAGLAQRTASGGGRSLLVFSNELAESVERNTALRLDVHLALRRNELTLEYLPQVDLERGGIRGFEALVRWMHPRYGAVGSEEIIKLAAEVRQLDALTRWTVRTSLEASAGWEVDGRHPEVTVNIGLAQVTEEGFVDAVLEARTQAGDTHGDLVIEMPTEVFLEASPVVEAALLRLWTAGVRVGVDDFGAAVGSLGSFQRYAVDQIKLDKSLVDPLGFEPDQEAYVAGIVALARALDYVVVAEGVEVQRQLDALEQLGVREAQGYFFSRPVSGADAGALIADRGIAPPRISLEQPFLNEVTP